jgi:hypothetical protein
MISYLLQGIAVGLLLQGPTELVGSPASSVWRWSPRGSTGTSLPTRPWSARGEEPRRRGRNSSLAVLLVLVLSACTTTQDGAGQAPHVVVVVEENHTLNQIIGSPQAPFLNQLASQGVLLTAYHAITHHSLPNYLAMVSGDTHGVTTSECTGCTFTGPNLAGQLEHAGISWKAYMQGLPAPCSDAAHFGAYVKRHDPFVYFEAVRRSPGQCHKVVPFSQFGADLAASRLPRFAFVVPDLKHDMHDGPVSVADGWLRDLHSQLVASSAWRPNTRLVVTFDEGTAGDNRVFTVVAGPRVRPRLDDTAYSHYSLLRSVETLFGLSHLGHAADASTATIPAVAATNNL